MSREGGCKYNLVAEPQSHLNKMGDGVGEVSLPEKETEEGEKGYWVVTCSFWHSGLQLTRYSISLFLNGFLFWLCIASEYYFLTMHVHGQHGSLECQI